MQTYMIYTFIDYVLHALLCRESLILNETASSGYLQEMFNHKLRVPNQLSETVSFWNISFTCMY